MRRRTILATVILANIMILGGLTASATAASSAPQAIVATSLDPTPQSRMEGNQAIDDATAAVLIGAISNQFGERNVEVKLDQVGIMPAGIIQRDIHGTGRLLLGSDDVWIPFAFTALYDTEKNSVGYPDLTLGSNDPAQLVSAHSAMGRKLTVEVDRRLRAEFAQQPAHVALDNVQWVKTADRYLTMKANGTADFGTEGTTDAGVQALYDLRSGQWLRVSYELGATANRAMPGAAVAIR